jgi:hypothetical protein
MKRILTYILLISSSICFGQFAIVNDKDSLLNVREDPTTSSRIIDRLRNGHMIYCFEDEGNWTNIDYTKNKIELHGFVYKDRYLVVSKFPALIKTRQTDSFITFKMDSLEVTITQGKFDKTKHKFKYLKDYPTQLELIDNKKYWGRDGGMPTMQYEDISIKIGDKIYSLPFMALEGLYQPSIYSAKVNFDKTNNTIYVQTFNSDGAGHYDVIWKIENGIYVDRLIALGF